jgi:hypothetical protein
MSNYIQGTVNGQSVSVMDIDNVGGDTYISFVDGSGNLKAVKFQYQHNTAFSTSASVTDSTSASVAGLTTNFNNLTTAISADTQNRAIIKNGFISPIKLVSSNYTVTFNDYVILSSATPVSGNPLSISMYSISARDGVEIEIKKIDNSTNDTILSGASTSETFDGVTSIAISVPNSSRRLKSFGGNWYII